MPINVLGLDGTSRRKHGCHGAEDVHKRHSNIPVDASTEAMRLNADDFVLSRHKTGCIEIGGTNDGRYST